MGSMTKVLSYLLESLKLSPEDVNLVNGPINFYRLMALPELVERPDLKFQPFSSPYLSFPTGKEKNFQNIKRDILLHHPYDSLPTPIVDF